MEKQEGNTGGNEMIETVTIKKCHCGRNVECYDFTNECPRCGQLYNWAGQALRAESEWGTHDGYRDW